MNQYAIASQIESGVSLARAQVVQPIHVHPPPTVCRVTQRERVIERESLRAVERVIVRSTEEEAGKPAEYAVINKVTPIIDAEMMITTVQMHDSASEDRSSTSASITDDTLSNLNLDAFEPVGANHREVVRIPVKVFSVVKIKLY